MKTVFTVLGIVTSVGVASLIQPPIEQRATCSFAVEVTAPAVQAEVEPVVEQPQSADCEVECEVEAETPAQTISVAPTEATQTVVEEPSCSQ